MLSESQFRAIFNENYELVYRISYRVLRNREDALDATQETFLKVYKKYHMFDGSSSIKTWIYRIAMNTALDFLRHRRRKKNVYVALEDVEQNRNVPDDRSLIETDIVNRDLFDKWHQEVFTKLPRKYQEPIILHEIEGLSLDETSKILGISKTTLKGRLARAKDKLRKLTAEWRAKNHV